MAGKLIILRGNSGSGKSTTALSLRASMGDKVMLVQQDVVRRQMLKVKDGKENPSIPLIFELAMYGKKIGFDVIVEGILTSTSHGDMLKSLITEFEKSYVYYFDIPFAETLIRHETKPNKHEFGETEMRDWWQGSDYLGVKGEKYITEDMSADDILNLILGDIKLDATDIPKES